MLLFFLLFIDCYNISFFGFDCISKKDVNSLGVNNYRVLDVFDELFFVLLRVWGDLLFVLK